MNGQQPQQQNEQRLYDVANKSSRVLLRISSVFPFQLTSQEVIVDQNKVSIVFYELFGGKQIYSIPIADVVGAHVESGPLFATLIIKPKVYGADLPPVRFLRREDAMHARRAIEGLVLCTEQGIDISSIPIHELARKVQEMGRTTEST